VCNPSSLWVRAENCFDPIVEREAFLAVQKMLKERRVDISEEEMLIRLKQTLKKKGRLTPKIINEAVDLPSARTFVDHFRTLRNAYSLIGYTSPRRCEYIDVRRDWVEPLSATAARICAKVQERGYRAVLHTLKSNRTNFNLSEQHLTVEGQGQIFFRVAYWAAGARPTFSCFSTVSCRRLPAGWIVAIRMSEHNRSVLDYVIMPTARNDSNMIRFREKGRAKHGVTYFKTEGELVRSVVRLVTRARRTAPLHQQPPSQPGRRSRSNVKAADARRR
jgi:hypothetical protein